MRSDEIEPGIRRIEVEAASIRRGDVLTLGGRPLIVLDHVAVRDGELSISFVSGERLSVNPATSLIALRADAPGLQTRSFWAVRLPDRPHEIPGRAEIVAQVVLGCALILTIGLAVVVR
ncbi:hypothetical protein [Streptomyces radicis]|uniref:Uncharacterized protein n=1 Tax=Streptomyces radicis TaxID=1750517 RepID=A0A3A9VW65_9ACTN|nr:hypothetical protein [Streptomyces radicis]RKN05245.1 hypothetical protein D7319_26115 [Streptomyces radicis]RKN16778.1 hypothetical protein D7318_25480 [Streptomyces radicis]